MSDTDIKCIDIRACILLAVATSALAGYLPTYGIGHAITGLSYGAAPAASYAISAPAITRTVSTSYHAAPVVAAAPAVATVAAAPAVTKVYQSAPVVASAPAVATVAAAPAVSQSSLPPQLSLRFTSLLQLWLLPLLWLLWLLPQLCPASPPTPSLLQSSLPPQLSPEFTSLLQLLPLPQLCPT
ncbi:hypothetical protein MRX96_009158 [Rhipicephalus microplus]